MSNLEKNNNNHKEEVLAKSKESSNVYNDEGMKNAQNKGRKLGIYYAGTIVGVPLFFISLYAGERLVVNAFLSMFFAFGVGEFVPIFRFTKQRRYMIAAVVLALFAAYFVVAFLANLENPPEWLEYLLGPLENLLGPLAWWS